jgi:Nitronate monooxygenase
MVAIETALTRLLGMAHPILLAPMGSAAGGKLAAAVTNAGGLGLIGSGYADPATKSPATCSVKRGSSSVPTCAQSRRALVRGSSPRCIHHVCAALPVGDQFARARLFKPCPRSTARAEVTLGWCHWLLRSLLIHATIVSVSGGACGAELKAPENTQLTYGDERHSECCAVGNACQPTMSREACTIGFGRALATYPALVECQAHTVRRRTACWM